MKAKTPLRAKASLRAKTSLQARKKPRKQKTPHITTLRRKADSLFSKAVRYRDGKLRGDGRWWCQCITCDSWNPMKNTHAGHFMKRGRYATRYDYENVNAQCPGCNTYRDGEQYKYGLAIDLKYGDGTAKKLYRRSLQKQNVNKSFLLEVIETAKKEIEFYERPA